MMLQVNLTDFALRGKVAMNSTPGNTWDEGSWGPAVGRNHRRPHCISGQVPPGLDPAEQLAPGRDGRLDLGRRHFLLALVALELERLDLDDQARCLAAMRTPQARENLARLAPGRHPVSPWVVSSS